MTGVRRICVLACFALICEALAAASSTPDRQVAEWILRKGGRLWLVANRHLPYEGVLTPLFAGVELKSQTGGFKVYEARK